MRVLKTQVPLVPKACVNQRSFVAASRRDFLKAGLTLLVAQELFPEKLFGKDNVNLDATYRIVPVGNNQKPVLFIWLQGGLSHIDSFCPLPNSPREVRGPYGVIETSASSLYVSEKLPNTAKQMHKVLLLKNIFHTQQDHSKATNKLFTGSDGTSVGDPIHIPFTTRLGNHLSETNLGYVIFTPDGVIHRGLGPGGALITARNYFGEDTENRLYESPLGKKLDKERFRGRNALLEQIETTKLDGIEPKRWEILRKRASSVLAGELDNAFDLSKVSEAEKERYGKNDIGYAGLTAKRMVERDAPFILINYRDWDHHQEIESSLNNMLPILDKLLASLIEDLSDKAIIVLASEFGRTPIVNNRKGRDHWPQANCMLISGPGVPTGVVGELSKYGLITGRDGEYNAALMGPTVLRLAGYELIEERNGVFTTNKMPYYPIFT